MAKRDLPPLRALTAFEAAARLGSFRLAAAELNITRSAVSHQVKALEQRLSVQLFRRDARRAELTQSGHLYFPAVRDAFDQIALQTKALRPATTDNDLTIQVYVTVALKWLIPRLYDFEKRYPDMRVRLATTSSDWDFIESNADAGFVLTRKRNSENYTRNLFRSCLIPVCSPALLKGPNAIHSLADLKNHKLLYVYTAEEDWHCWLNAAGVPDVKLSESLAFDSYLLAQEAALEGRGIAMTIGPFASDDLKSGRLVHPFPQLVPHKYNWQFVCRDENKMKPKISKFEAWLARQIAADPNLEPYREKSDCK